MKDIGVLLQKEWRENIRSFKILWIPLVFIILGVMEPLTYYFLPQIMSSVGNVPEGVDFVLPELLGEDIFASLTSQYQFIGLLVVILAFMGTISRERKSGAGTLLYVRPISYVSYFMSKWLTVNGIVLISLTAGYMASWYYIDLLYNSVDPAGVFQLIASYFLWFMFVVTLTLAASAWLSTGGAAAVALLITFFGQIVDAIVGKYWTVTPWKLALYSPTWLKNGPDSDTYWLTVLLTAILIAILIAFGIWMSKKNAAKTKI
ncbi:ABC transporter permease [Chungangia koreensis]|uniref:ABC transporter permease n=1 Tax=Chungangia koreensis TaxID=752657 RepID=A0ABV8WZY1_9LACT